MKDKVISSGKGFKEETPQNLTPIFVEDLAIEIMESNKNIEMFQAMAIINLKMGNLGLEVQSLKTTLTTVEGEKRTIITTFIQGLGAHEIQEVDE
jgi:hypothetical protein